jgi:hypothetical protein
VGVAVHAIDPRAQVLQGDVGAGSWNSGASWAVTAARWCSMWAI